MAFRFVPRLFNQVRDFDAKRLTGRLVATRRRRLCARRSSLRALLVCWHHTLRLTLPGKYASAAYVSALTRGEKSLLKVESDLKAFNELLRGNSQTSSELRTYLTNPTISAEDRIKTVDMILAQQKGNEDEITRYALSECLADTPATCLLRLPRTAASTSPRRWSRASSSL